GGRGRRPARELAVARHHRRSAGDAEARAAHPQPEVALSHALAVVVGGRLFPLLRRRGAASPGGALMALQATRLVFRLTLSNVDDPRRAAELCAQLDGWKRKIEHVSVWLIPASLTSALARREERQHKWQVTVVGDHFYVDADGQSLEGPIERLR